MTLTAVCASVGCATQGVGAGSWKPRYDAAQRDFGPVVFRWRSDGPSATKGRITAVFPDGESFSGQYRQPTRNLETFGPDWRQAEPGMEVPPIHPADPGAFFIEGVPTDHALPPHSGRLLAKLKGPEGAEMLCWFQLRHPQYGPAGGATGTCRLSDGERIDDARLG
jgi:hypothetical protein